MGHQQSFPVSMRLMDKKKKERKNPSTANRLERLLPPRITNFQKQYLPWAPLLANYPWKIECFMEDLFLGGQSSIILGYRRLSVNSLLVCNRELYLLHNPSQGFLRQD